MANDPAMQDKLLEILSTIEFDRRYYTFHDAHRVPVAARMAGVKRKDLEEALLPTGLAFRYHAPERVMLHTERHGQVELTFNVALLGSTLELILFVAVGEPAMAAGGTFSSLALAVGQRRDSSFAPDPPYPKLAFANREQLGEAARFSAELFIDARHLILEHLGSGRSAS